MNILKLIVLIPFMFVLSVMIGGTHWLLVMGLALGAGWFYFKWEQNQKKRKAQLRQDVETTRQAMIQANVEVEQARIRAEQLRIDEQRAKDAAARAAQDYMKGQLN